MLNDYCFNQCPIGQEYKKQVLEDNDSVFDAVYDYKNLINVCLYTCNKFKNREENLDDGEL